MSIEAMKLIRDAIEQGVDLNQIGAKHILDKAIAEAEKQEPFAWMSNESAYRLKHGGNSKGTVPVHAKKSTASKIPLYTRPQTTQEPAAWGMEHPDGDIIDVITPEEHAREEGGYRVALYREPQPKREWVWLTPEEITALKHNGKRYISSQDFARAVEALSKEKNAQ